MIFWPRFSESDLLLRAELLAIHAPGLHISDSMSAFEFLSLSTSISEKLNKKEMPYQQSHDIMGKQMEQWNNIAEALLKTLANLQR